MKKEDRIRLAQKNKDEGNDTWIDRLGLRCDLHSRSHMRQLQDMFKAQKFDDARGSDQIVCWTPPRI